MSLLRNINPRVPLKVSSAKRAQVPRQAGEKKVHLRFERMNSPFEAGHSIEDDLGLAVFGRSSLAAVDVSAVDHRGSVDLAATNAADEGARASQNGLGWRKT